VIEKLKSKDRLVSYFTLELEEQLNFEPGQFVMLSN
jgi:NAD(P)H-flavin reductase